MRRDIIISIPADEVECGNCPHFNWTVVDGSWCIIFNTVLSVNKNEPQRCQLCLDAEARLRDLEDYKQIAARVVAEEGK